MTFFYYEINTRRFIQSTNIRALEEFSGISYHKIWNWFTDGDNLHVDDSVICGCSDLVRGKQRIQKITYNEIGLGSKGIRSGELKPSIDQTGPGCPIGSKGDEGIPGVSTKRTTKQPDNRNMKQYDDFFKEVE